MAYTFDVPYSPTYFHDMNPDYLAWIISNNGMYPPSVNNVLEIGCGNGLNLIIPAINSSAKFVGLDPNPTHINFAKKIADKVEITSNTDFRCEYVQAHEPVNGYDYIHLHGVLSWIDIESISHLTQKISEWLNPGGMLYVSYNTKVGWSELQAWRTLVLASCSTETVSSKRIQKLRTLTSRLLEVQGERLEESMRRRYEKILTLSDWYSAHEYLNSTWNLFSPSEVINAFGESNVTYIGNLDPLVNFKGLCLPTSELALINEVSESVAISEDMFALLTKQGFRKDIFVKGPVRLPEGDRSFENHFQLTKVRDITTPVSITGFYAKGDLPEKISNYLDSNIEIGAWIRWDKIVSDLASMGHSKLNVSSVCQALISNGALRLVDTRRLNEDATSEQWKMFNQLVIDKIFDSDPLEFWLDERRGAAIAVPRLQLAIEYLRRNQVSLDARNVVTNLNKRGVTLSRQGEDESDQMQVAERQLQQFMTTGRLIDAVTG